MISRCHRSSSNLCSLNSGYFGCSQLIPVPVSCMPDSFWNVDTRIELGLNHNCRNMSFPIRWKTFSELTFRSHASYLFPEHSFWAATLVLEKLLDYLPVELRCRESGAIEARPENSTSGPGWRCRISSVFQSSSFPSTAVSAPRLFSVMREGCLPARATLSRQKSVSCYTNLAIASTVPALVLRPRLHATTKPPFLRPKRRPQ